jgi:hypothetical protein
VPRFQGIHSNTAILVAAAIATVLSPLLFYACTMPVAPFPPMMVYTGPAGALHATVDAISFAPQVLVALFAVAVLVGGVFSMLRLRHVGFYLLAGGAVALGASQLAPLLLGAVAYVIMAPELENLKTPAVLAGVLLAGLADGAVFWLIVRHFD